jgi:hypothetical protein
MKLNIKLIFTILQILGICLIGISAIIYVYSELMEDKIIPNIVELYFLSPGIGLLLIAPKIFYNDYIYYRYHAHEKPMVSRWGLPGYIEVVGGIIFIMIYIIVKLR